MNKNDYLNSYYSTYQEDARLTATKHGLVEYLTTMKYIHRFLNKGMRILEIGAGTGRYSLALAKEGFRVDAVELLTHNLDILRSKMAELPDGGSIRHIREMPLIFPVLKTEPLTELWFSALCIIYTRKKIKERHCRKLAVLLKRTDICLWPTV